MTDNDSTKAPDEASAPRETAHDTSPGQNVLTGFAALVAAETGIDPEDVQPTSRLVADLGLDSLALMSVIVNTEERFGVRIPDARLAGITTVADVVDSVESARADGDGRRR